MTHIGEARWQQFVLEECDAETVLAVEAHLQSCPECRQRLAHERRLDEWLLQSVPAAAAGSAERSLQRLWEEVDETEAVPVVHDWWRRRVAFWLPAVAACVLAMVWLMEAPLDEFIDGRGEERAAGSRGGAAPMTAFGSGRLPTPSAAQETPATPAAPLNPRRLREAQQRTAAVLLAAQALSDGGGGDSHVFGQACDEGLATLRRQGWPVGSLVRGWALGEAGEVANAALRYAVQEPSLGNILAAALDLDRPRLETVLAHLAQDPAPIESSLALVRALERTAERDGAEGRCSALLARASGARPAQALRRLLKGRVDHAAADPTSASAGEALLQLAALAPVPQAVEALLSVAHEPLREPTMRAAFLARVKTDRVEGALALKAQLNKRRPPAVLLDWIVAAELPELVPALLIRLEHDPADEPALAAVVALGGALATGGLATLWLDETGPRRGALLSGLSAVLDRDPRELAILGSALARRGSEEALQLSENLPREFGPPLLLGCLAAMGATVDGGGHQAALLLALGRHGRSVDVPGLLAWIHSRSPTDSLLPLAWAAVAQLDETLAKQAWRDLGHDPAPLTRVATSAARRFATSSLPTDRLLNPLRRALTTDAD